MTGRSGARWSSGSGWVSWLEPEGPPGVTLGALSFPRDAAGNIIRGMKRHPTLEDDVVVYANATILGGDTVIGHHAVIGSSVWVTQSVEPFTSVTLEKPQLRIKRPEMRKPGELA